MPPQKDVPSMIPDDTKMQNQNIEAAYQYCQDIARQHYENFPTTSILLNPVQRRATAAIYAFARHADDLADEGERDAATRLDMLKQYRQYLTRIYQGEHINDPVFIALTHAIGRFELPERALGDLLQAFSMDVTKKRYANFDELLGYCRYSANPIGELVLRLHAVCTEQTKILSDQICTALQLINFIQDIDEDFKQRQRIYIPQDEMTTFAVTEDMFENRVNNSAMQKLMQFQLDRATAMLVSGSVLIDHLHGKLKFVITLTVCAGLRISMKLQKRPHCFDRPTLTAYDWIKIVLHAMYFRPNTARAKLQQTTH